MLKKFLATAMVLAMVAGANATVSASLVNAGSGVLPVNGSPYEIWQVQIDVTNTDDWTASAIATTAPLTSGTFFQQPLSQLGGDVAPNPILFGAFGDLQYDSFYGDPLGHPNAAAPGTASFAAGPADTATTLSADWFDLVNTGDGSYIVLQMTVINADPGYTASFHLDYAGANTGGTLFGYDFTIPEPASLALLALGGLALVRRR